MAYRRAARFLAGWLATAAVFAAVFTITAAGIEIYWHLLNPHHPWKIYTGKVGVHLILTHGAGFVSGLGALSSGLAAVGFS